MKISPLDIRKQEFRKVMRGWDPQEVRSFLEHVASEFERTLVECSMLGEKVQGLEARLEEYRQLEQMLRNSLVTAERITSESRDASEREANRILQDAHARSERILGDARERLQILVQEIENLRTKKEVFIRRFQALLEGQLAIVHEHGQENGDLEMLERGAARLAAQIDAERQRLPEPVPRPEQRHPEQRREEQRPPEQRREEQRPRPQSSQSLLFPSRADAVENRDMTATISAELLERQEGSRPRLPVRRAEPVQEAPPRPPMETAAEPAAPRGVGRFFRRNEGVVPVAGGRPPESETVRGRSEGVYEISANEPPDNGRESVGGR